LVKNNKMSTSTQSTPSPSSPSSSSPMPASLSSSSSSTPHTEPPALPEDVAERDGESVEPSKKRAAKRPEEWIYELIEIVAKEGKNWDKVLNILHQRHLAQEIKSKEKLRRKWNNLLDERSAIWNPYETPQLKIAGRKGLSKEEVARRMKEHAERHQVMRLQHEHAQEMLREVEKRELVANSDENEEEEEIRRTMQEKAEERRTDRLQKRARVTTNLSSTEKFQTDVTGSIDFFKEIALKSVKMSEATGNKIIEYLDFLMKDK
jgi:hypothetical protein